MSAHAYTEDQLVEQPAIGLFAELGWQTVSALEEICGKGELSPRPSPRPSRTGHEEEREEGFWEWRTRGGLPRTRTGGDPGLWARTPSGLRERSGDSVQRGGGGAALGGRAGPAGPTAT